jgi:hypothetical protein
MVPVANLPIRIIFEVVSSVVVHSKKIKGALDHLYFLGCERWQSPISNDLSHLIGILSEEYGVVEPPEHEGESSVCRGDIQGI